MTDYTGNLIIQTAGLDYITTGANLASIMYFLPIYDHRIDPNIHTPAYQHGTSAIYLSAAANITDVVNYSVSSNSNVPYGEMLYNVNAFSATSGIYSYRITNTEFLYSSAREISATTTATDVISIIQSSASDIDYVNRLLILTAGAGETPTNDLNLTAYQFLSSAYATASTPRFMEYDDTTHTWYIKNTRLISGGNEIRREFSSSWSNAGLTAYGQTVTAGPAPDNPYTGKLYPIASYQPIVTTASEHRGVYKCVLDSRHGDFKFNKIGLFAQQLTTAGTVNNSIPPALVATAMLKEPVLKTTSGYGISRFEMDVELQLTPTELTLTKLAYINDDYWTRITTAGAIHYGEKVGINTLSDNIAPRKPLEVMDSTDAQLRLSNNTANYTDFRSSGGNLIIGGKTDSFSMSGYYVTTAGAQFHPQIFSVSGASPVRTLVLGSRDATGELDQLIVSKNSDTALMINVDNNLLWETTGLTSAFYVTADGDDMGTNANRVTFHIGGVDGRELFNTITDTITAGDLGWDSYKIRAGQGDAIDIEVNGQTSLESHVYFKDNSINHFDYMYCKLGKNFHGTTILDNPVCAIWLSGSLILEKDLRVSGNASIRGGISANGLVGIQDSSSIEGGGRYTYIFYRDPDTGMSVYGDNGGGRTTSAGLFNSYTNYIVVTDGAGSTSKKFVFRASNSTDAFSINGYGDIYQHIANSYVFLGGNQMTFTTTTADRDLYNIVKRSGSTWTYGPITTATTYDTVYYKGNDANYLVFNTTGTNAEMQLGGQAVLQMDVTPATNTSGCYLNFNSVQIGPITTAPTYLAIGNGNTGLTATPGSGEIHVGKIYCDIITSVGSTTGVAITDAKITAESIKLTGIDVIKLSNVKYPTMGQQVLWSDSARTETRLGGWDVNPVTDTVTNKNGLGLYKNQNEYLLLRTSLSTDDTIPVYNVYVAGRKALIVSPNIEGFLARGGKFKSYADITHIESSTINLTGTTINLTGTTINLTGTTINLTGTTTRINNSKLEITATDNSFINTNGVGSPLKLNWDSVGYNYLGHTNIKALYTNFIGTDTPNGQGDPLQITTPNTQINGNLSVTGSCTLTGGLNLTGPYAHFIHTAQYGKTVCYTRTLSMTANTTAATRFQLQNYDSVVQLWNGLTTPTPTVAVGEAIIAMPAVSTLQAGQKFTIMAEFDGWGLRIQPHQNDANYITVTANTYFRQGGLQGDGIRYYSTYYSGITAAGKAYACGPTVQNGFILELTYDGNGHFYVNDNIVYTTILQETIDGKLFTYFQLGNSQFWATQLNANWQLQQFGNTKMVKSIGHFTILSVV